RFAEPLIEKPRLAKRLASIRAYRDTLPNIDRELAFLQYLKTNQPVYIDPIFALADAAPFGTRLESLTINRHGDLSLRASMRDSQQVVQFRSKLIDSGLFASVVVEEQTPGQQKTTVRMLGQWKPSAEIPTERGRRRPQQRPNQDSVAQIDSPRTPGVPAGIDGAPAGSVGNNGPILEPEISAPPNISQVTPQSPGSRRSRTPVSPPIEDR